MVTYHGKTALITGASSGIGASFAQELARRGANLVLSARSEDKLNALADELRERYGIRADVIVTDLSEERAASKVYAAVQERNLSIDLLINNAGFATYGRFETLTAERDHQQVMLNVTALADLTHAFLPGMAQRGDGAIINVASTAAFQPVPYMATYGASKAFVLSFSEALWAEYRGRGVRILALCPGPVETPFFDVVGAQEAAIGPKDTPERVVAAALRALERGRSFVIPGWGNALQSNISRFIPRQLTARIVERLARPRSDGVTNQTPRQA